MTTFRQDIRLGKKVPLMKTDDYDDKSVTTEKLADLSVTTEKLHDEAVTERTIAENAVCSGNIAAGAVETIHIAEGAVTEKELDDNAVTTSKVKDGCITNAKLARNSVQSWNIGAQAIDSTQIRLGGIESQSLADSSVVNRTIANKAVTSAKLGDESVLISKIAQEVWDKLKNEYLRLDGIKSMENNLSMGNHCIDDVIGIRRNTSFGASISFEDIDDIVFETIEVDGSAEPYHRIFAIFSQGETKFPNGKVLSDGFKTIDRTNIGLLVNDGTVGLALTDSEIDKCLAKVFSNV